ncbi:MAG: hypothetical protein K0Q76_2065 [Panacagrimonas sp.]|jgi:hypothetical protein|nr:hypothetical protein [Panacagrimonas sp.]MCC2656957.1 hypothetical protein [Panacagrimonas sp.]
MNMLVYLIGAILVIAALAYGASALGMQAFWIGIGAAVLLGLCIMTAVSKTQRKE